MAEQTNESGEKLLEIERLTQRAHDVGATVSLWNRWYMIFVALTVVLAAGVFITQFIASRRSTELSGIQEAIITEKDRLAGLDSKTKDGKIADASLKAGESNKAAGEASERAGKAEERAAEANAKAEGFRADIAKANERLATARKETEGLAEKTELLRQQNLATESRIESERKKRVDLAASLLPRDFFDQSGAINRLSGVSPMKVVFSFPNEAEPRSMAEQIAIVFAQLKWPFSRIRSKDEEHVSEGVTLTIGRQGSPTGPRSNPAIDALTKSLIQCGIEASEGYSEFARFFPSNTIIVSVGPKPNHELEQTLRDLGPKTPEKMGAFEVGGNRIMIPDGQTINP